MLPSNKLLGVAILGLFAASANAAAATSDPCAHIAGNKTASFQDAKACLDYFKYDKDIAQQTVDTVRKVTNELYVFNVNQDADSHHWTTFLTDSSSRMLLLLLPQWKVWPLLL